MLIYLISGLGVDYRVFSKLKLDGYELRFIKWQVPYYRESLTDYALRLAKEIDHSRPFSLIGFSFGGMLATEIAKKLKPEKLVLISSAKGEKELPLRIRLLRFIPLHRVVAEWIYRWLAWRLRWFYGIREREHEQLFYSMIHSIPRGFRKRAANCIINWRNNEPINALHLHGNNDIVIPYRNIKNAVCIKGGTHFMLLDRAEEISKIIRDYLSRAIPDVGDAKVA